MANITALITGVNGFIGSHLARIIKTEMPDVSIVGVDLSVKPGDGQALQLDLLDQNAVARVIERSRPDYIFHLAGVIYSSDLQELYRGNVQTTVNLLEAVKVSHKSARVIIPGSAAEYGHIASEDLPIAENHLPSPLSPYGVAKVWQTTIARYYAMQNLDVQVGRIFNVIGRNMPEGLSIGTFAKQLSLARSGNVQPRLTVGNLKPKRDFVDVEDVCRGFLAMAKNGVSGEIYNICSGKSISIEDVLGLMIEQSGLDVEVVVDSSRFKGADVADIYGDCSKLSSIGWMVKVPIAKSIEGIME